MDIKNIIKKVIQNVQTLFSLDEDGKEMYFLITFLEQAGYDVRIQVKPNQEVKGGFFLYTKMLLEKHSVGLRLLPLMQLIKPMLTK